MKVVKYPSRQTWGELLKRPVLDNASLNESVQLVIDEIRQKGDEAIKKYTGHFDNVELDQFEISAEEWQEAAALVSVELKEAMQVAAKNIETFHKQQLEGDEVIETMPGVKCWQKQVPIESVGLYVPGGTAPLFSTVLMLAIPAKIAGCEEIVLCSPPNKEGKLPAAILYAAKLAGVSKVFKIGGVQAIGAMALGTESVPKVCKIFGPGNQFVTAAKQLVSIADVAIDMPAGPSEVAIMADDSADASFVAADLLSQAEHGADSQVVLVTSSEELIGKVTDELEAQLGQLPRKEIAEKALLNSNILLVKNQQEMVQLINAYAPEHLIISTENYLEVAAKITNAGSVFLGNYTPESAGDYASGTNHTLPTNGWAKSYSGVNMDSFMRKITFQEISKAGIQELGKTIEVMAEAEMLFAHKNAATLRMQ
ncbi:histidinol dehydrogenase [Prolixibacteraceae bacterium JC049]|nr:histidinol dehydrogenase [Prolixibacteraceae bacterium JC049]